MFSSAAASGNAGSFFSDYDAGRKPSGPTAIGGGLGSRRLSLLDEQSEFTNIPSALNIHQSPSPQPGQSPLSKPALLPSSAAGVSGGGASVHPSYPAFRRTRAETFSSFPSKLLPDDHLNSMGPIGSHPGGSAAGRMRSGSLSLPSNDLSLAFGPSLFSTNWPPSSSPNMPSSGFAGVDVDARPSMTGGISSSLKQGGTGGSSGIVSTRGNTGATSTTASNLAAMAELSESITLSEETTNAVARTLDYLGLDDNPSDMIGMLPRRASTATGASSSSGGTAVGSAHMGQFLRSHTSPRLQGIEMLNGGGAGTNSVAAAASSVSKSPSLLPFAGAGGLPLHHPHHPHHGMGHSRSRSYSVTVGDSFSMSLHANVPVYRPRSSSIAHIETLDLAETALQAFRMPYMSKRESPDRPNEPTAAELQQLHLGKMGYGDLALDGFPPGLKGANGASGGGGGSIGGGSVLMTPSRSLWVGNIDINLSPADLLAAFSPFGPIESLRILPERECAFVNFHKTEDAILARETLQGTRIGGLSSGSGVSGAAAGGVRIGFGKVEAISDAQGSQPTKSLWIGNIPPSTDPLELEAIFSAFGPIESARVLTHKNCGFVNFDKLEDAMEARKVMNGKEIGGSVVKIGYAKVPGKFGSVVGTSDVSVQLGFGQSGAATPGTSSSPSTGATGSVSTGASSTLADSPGEAGAGAGGLGKGEDGIDGEPTGASDGEYASALPPLPEPLINKKIDQVKLRDMRKRLEGNLLQKEIDQMYHEILDETVDLCTDYIGNVVVQKVLERSPEDHRLALIEKVAPHMAVIGIHKNGTWVVQKMIDIAKTPQQMNVIVNALKRYTPPLLLDQFGNYVVQCCLRLGSQRNQFIFDAIHTKCLEIGFGRFGARAIRACLESQYTTKRQQKHVAMAIVQNSAQLVTNPNGAILVTWLLDSSSLPGRYRVIAPKLVPFLAAFCNHKLASSTILKLVNQRIELDAREVVVKELFFKDDNTLKEVLSDLTHGVSTIQKILATACITPDERVRFGDRVRSILARMPEVQENPMGFKRLLDELAAIPSSLTLGALDASGLAAHDIVSPLTPHAGFFTGAPQLNPAAGGYYAGPGGHLAPNGSATASYLLASPPHPGPPQLGYASQGQAYGGGTALSPVGPAATGWGGSGAPFGNFHPYTSTAMGQHAPGP
ncbi:hypothetical protein HDU96_004418 [Phlyctochytrium bullatum]|nr:hypothetical protein HDU96_004418 [Phlyctochytrium bullatum]